jgi:hypothetical protein
MKRPVSVSSRLADDQRTGVVTLTDADGITSFVTVEFIWMASRIERHAATGDFKLFRAVREMNKIGETGKDMMVLASFLAEEWKKSPCMYKGTPNKAAMYLLNGLRMPVIGRWKTTRNGKAMRDTVAGDLFDAGLLRDASEERSQRVRYMTNLNGHALLEHWAEKNKQFAQFFIAYQPKKWVEKELERVAFCILEGKDAGLLPPDYMSSETLNKYIQRAAQSKARA